ncbi:MAG: stage III sporulation protein AA [Clostridia bacterium]|nr:stage III sporulation protein AA [Clostridia bacterium]
MINRIKNQILYFFPEYIKEKINEYDEILSEAQEIRVRVGQPICIRNYKKEVFLSRVITSEDILKIIENFSNNSIYSVQNEINAGFLTIKGGHRVGLTGTCIFENNTVKNIKYISSLNIRVAREIKGCSTNILKCITSKKEFDNTLILSPPGCGKTTIVRDMIRQLSNGNDYCTPYNIGVADERSEIAAMYKGVPQNDIGKRTDVINNCSKYVGMKMLIRSMAPQIIATDEIGGKQDEDAMFEAIYSGVKLLLTAHGEKITDIPKNIIDSKVIKNIIVLKKVDKPGEIEKILNLEEDKYVSSF